ncbi:MAG TPA: lysine--tRNA ligase [Pyrinomonadaceae bacterium]|jgi:lysyl-tRNA synthetase class 2
MSIANTKTETIVEAGIIEENDQVAARVEHLKELETLVGNSYPNKFDRTRISGKEDTISNILAFAPVKEIVKELKNNTPEGEKPNQELKESLNARLKAFGNARVSGRIAVPPRVMGKAAFVHLSDGKERLQIYVRKQDAKPVDNNTGRLIEEEGKAWEVFGLLDHGDFVGVEGYLFLTNTGELSVHVETLQFLSKALLPMPDKMHGIADPELRRRFRYADLIASSLQVEQAFGGLTTREVFERRAKLISGMRRFLDDAGYTEVETPMLTPKATGAAATPFETHHNALDIPLYARIAPELYLKRLTVGGFEKVYELNRNFRNEGLSHKHNPEFTMLEFYCAYMDVGGMMDFAEEMIKESVEKATGGSLQVEFDGQQIDFSDFERLTMRQAIAKHFPHYFLRVQLRGDGISLLNEDFSVSQIYWFYKTVESEADKIYKATLKSWAEDKEKGEYSIDFSTFKRCNLPSTFFEDIWSQAQTRTENLKAAGEQIDSFQTDKQIEEMFEAFVEEKLINPTFIIDYPKSISPLSKASPDNPNIAERFELFINGMECANGFSELNDPQEQYERFAEQMRARETGDAEAMVLDEDYIRALAYGMPPAAGIGIGIDRLVMLLTNRHSIRDVILFPHMRPERKETEKETE